MSCGCPQPYMSKGCTVYRRGPQGPTGASGLRGIPGDPGEPGPGILPGGVITGDWTGAWLADYTRSTTYYTINNICVMHFASVIEIPDAGLNATQIFYSGVVPAGFLPAEDAHFSVVGLTASNNYILDLLITTTGIISATIVQPNPLTPIFFSGLAAGMYAITVTYELGL